MRSLVHEEPDWVSVDGNFEDEVWGRARLHRLPGHPVMEGVDQRLVKVQHKNLPLDNAQPVANAQRQVWSLTQFSYVGFSQSTISVKKCVFTNTKSRFAPIVFDGVSRPLRLG